MTRRQWVLLGVVAALVAFRAWPGLPGQLIGFWRGEATYKGRHTNSWRKDLRWDIQMYGGSIGSGHWERYNRISPTDEVFGWIVGFRRPKNEREVLLLQDDPEAIPVLVELLTDSDSSVRITAADALGRLGDKAAVAVPPLFDALKNVGSDNDECRSERWAIEDALYSIDYHAASEARLGKGRWWW